MSIVSAPTFLARMTKPPRPLNVPLIALRGEAALGPPDCLTDELKRLDLPASGTLICRAALAGDDG